MKKIIHKREVKLLKLFKLTVNISLLVMFISCSSHTIIIKKPLSHKQFQAQKGTLKGKQFILVNTYFYSFSTNVQVSVNKIGCYILLVSSKPIKIEKEMDDDNSKRLYPPQQFISVYIPISDIKLVKDLLELINGDKISRIIGNGHYPSISFLFSQMRLPNSTVGVLAQKLEIHSVK